MSFEFDSDCFLGNPGEPRSGFSDLRISACRTRTAIPLSRLLNSRLMEPATVTVNPKITEKAQICFSKSAPDLIEVSDQAALAAEKVRRGKIAGQFYFGLDGSGFAFDGRVLSHELDLSLDAA